MQARFFAARCASFFARQLRLSVSRRRGGVRNPRCQGWGAVLSLVLGSCSVAIVSGCGSPGDKVTAAMTAETGGTLISSTSAISFGSVMVGQTASASVTMSNGSTNPIQISGVQVTGQFFSVMGQGNLPVTIAGGSTYTVNVQFEPGAAGMATGTLTVLSNSAGEGTTTIVLSGTGESSPSIALSGLSCASGTVTGASTDACTVTLTGAAGAGGLVVSLSSSSSAVTVPASVTVPAGASSAGFMATASAVTTTQTVTLTATAGTVTESYALQLSPSAPAMTLQLNGLSCSSGTVTGAGTDACTVTLTGAADAGGLVVSLSSSSNAVTVPASVTVPAGATSAGFTATASAVATTQTATLSATAGNVTESYALQLSPSAPALTLQSTSVSFGDVTLNTLSTQAVTLTSSGTAPLTINAGMVTGTGFSISGISFPVTLNPSQTASLDIEFDPAVTGAATGTVTLTDNTSAGKATIALKGTGQAASYEVDLTWDAPRSSSDPVAGYDIYRAVSGSSSYQLLNSTIDVSTTYTDTTVVDGMAYQYYATSVDASGNQSAPSNIFSVTIP